MEKILKIQEIKYLYHVTNTKFDKIDIDKYGSVFKDYGQGFYLTTNLQQAWNLAHRKANNQKEAYVYQYELKDFDSKEYNIYELLEYNEEWLDIIAENRIRGVCHIADIDIIYDRMADNKGDVLGKELADYLNDKKNGDEVIEKIRFANESKDQYCFKTAKALHLLINRKLMIDSRDRRGYWKYGRKRNISGSI